MANRLPAGGRPAAGAGSGDAAGAAAAGRPHGYDRDAVAGERDVGFDGGPAHADRYGLHAERLQRLEALADWLDSRWRLPGTNFRFGLDSVVGLIPGAGDAVMSAVSGWIVIEALRAGARKRTIARMLGNIGIDFAVGAVPLVGDLFDASFKANRRNVSLLTRALREGKTRRG
jgi:hypothetical protein